MPDQSTSTTDKAKTMTLSLRLLREGYSVEDALREDHSLVEEDSDKGRLFTGQSESRPPDWLKIVSNFSNSELTKLENKHCSALVFIDIESEHPQKAKRTIAITFGTAHHALQPNAFERNFGLRVTLNSVARSDLRNLDIATLDATSFQKRIQASRKADLNGFGIDTQRDLLRLAGGVPKDSSFAKILTGKDALTITTKIQVDDIAEKCKTAIELFSSTEYKKDFAFIDFITPIHENDLLLELDSLVLHELRELISGKPSDLHLSLPDLLSPEASYEIGYFGLGLKPGKKTAYPEVCIEDYVAELQAGKPQEILDMATLRASQEIRVVIDGEGTKKQRCRVYDCFIYETTHKNETFVLFAGEWFRVDKKFHIEIETAFKKRLSTTPFVAFTTSKNERELIKELNKQPDLLELDQARISPSNAPGANIEPCDFLSKQKAFIHLKNGQSSEPISHLWNQALVSAECFVRDIEFRHKLRLETIKRQQKSHKQNFEALLPDRRSKPSPTDYTIIFGIMRQPYKKSGALGLPFFSKVSFRPIAERIEIMGYTVEIHLIEMRS